MEAVPRLPMLFFELKHCPTHINFGPQLKKYIREHFHEDPDAYNGEIQEIDGLRVSAVRPAMDLNGCATLKKYYCQLHFLQSRFPLKGDQELLLYKWKDAYSSNIQSATDIRYEMACIMYNIAALHTSLGAMDPRTSSDGMKVSCTHFQHAIWAFQYLRDEFPGYRDTEFHPTLLTFMANVSYAQAQECLVEKSMTDNRKPNIIAKLAMQVVEYLKAAVKNLEHGRSEEFSFSDIVGSKVTKAWSRYCDFKIAYYSAVTMFFLGIQSDEQQKMGERIAYYQASVDRLQEAMKLSKNSEKKEVLNETLTFANDIMSGKLSVATTENDLIYHERVPALESLGEVKGASLVKGISFSVSDDTVSGPDIFSRLVPIGVHEISSIYSEEKAKLLRSICSQIQEKNDELQTYIASMQLDSISLDDNEVIPHELVEACADLNSRNGIKELGEIMQEISKYYLDCNKSLDEVHQLIELEDEKEKEYSVAVGAKRAPNMILGELKREGAKYKEAHQSAQDNNTALHRAITQHHNNLNLLSQPLDHLTASLPSVMAVEKDGDQEAKSQVRRLMKKVKEMQVQREHLESQLRSDIHNDDITKQVITVQEAPDDFFKIELEKHSKVVNLLEMNMKAQTKILQALSEANAAYATTRLMTNQVQAQRNEMIGELLSSYNVFINITKKAEDAKEFYHKLESQINKLLARAKSVCRVAEEEREERLAANVKKFTGGFLPKTPLGMGMTMPDPGSSTSGPKLKDFLQHSTGSRIPGGAPSVIPGAPGYNYSTGHTAEYGAYNSSYRPPPTGSEQTPNAKMPYQPGTGYESAYPPSAPAPSPAPQLRSDQMNNTQVPGYNSSSASQVPTHPTVTQAYPTYPLNHPRVPGRNLPSSNNSSNHSSPTHTPYSYSQHPNYPIDPSRTMISPVPPSTTVSYSASNAYNYNQYVATSTAQMPNASQIPTSVPGNTNQHLPTQTPYGQNYYQAPVNSVSPIPTSNTTVSNSSSASNVSVPSQQAGASTVTSAGYPHQTNTMTSYQYYSGHYNTNQYGAYPTGQNMVPNTTYPISTKDQTQPNQSASVSTAANTNAYQAGTNTPYAYQYPSMGTSSNQYPAGIYSGTGANPYSGNVPASQYQAGSAGTGATANPYSSVAGQYPVSTTSAQLPTTTATVSQYPGAAITSQYPGTTATSQYPGAAPTSQYPGGIPTSQYSGAAPISQYPGTAATTQYPGASNNSQYPITSSTSQYPTTITAGQYPVTTSTTSTAAANHYPAAATAGTTGYYPPYNTGVPANQYQAGTVKPPYQAGAPTMQYQSGVPTAQYPAGVPTTQYPGTKTNSYQAGVTTTQAASAQYPVGYQSYTGAQYPGNIPVNYYQTGNTTTQYPSTTYPTTATVPNNSVGTVPGQVNPTVGGTQAQKDTTNGSGNNNTPSVNAVPSNTSANTNKGISNLDLLSGIDMTAHTNSQWSPLTPQLIPSSSAPDVTETSASNSKDQVDAKPVDSQPSELPNVVSSSTPPVPSSDLNSISDSNSTSAGLIASLNKEKKKSLTIDPFSDDETLNALVLETERLNKFVEGLDKKSLNGPANIDVKWKEFSAVLEEKCSKLKVSVGRCYPMKNRFPDILPFDHTRVQLPSPRDDYINASYVQIHTVEESMPLILTQAPISSTVAEFWSLVWEQQVETIVCIHSDVEVKGELYWPKEPNIAIEYSTLSITLHSCKEVVGCPWIQRTFHINHRVSKTSRVVIHLQFLAWPPSAMPESPGPFLQFIVEAHSLHKQQRNKLRPVLTHCVSGIGRSGVFATLSSFIKELNTTGTMADILSLIVELNEQRRNGIPDKDYLLFTYSAALYYVQDILMKRGILTNKATFEDGPREKTHCRHPSADLLSSYDLTRMKAKLGLDQNEEQPSCSREEFSAQDIESKENHQNGANDTLITKKETTISTLDLETLPPNLADSVDPEKFKLEPPNIPKISKEDFNTSNTNNLSQAKDPNDPFSDIDPLWSLKNSKS